MAAMRMLFFVPLLLAGVRGQDPLAEWVSDLKFSLQDVTQEKAGITFKVSQLVCQNFQLTDIQSSTKDMTLSVTMNGVGIECTGHFEYKGLAIVSGAGDLQATVKSSPSSTASVVLQGTKVEKGLPWGVEAASCSGNVDFKLKLSGSILYDIVNLFSAPVSALIKAQAVSQGCGKLKEMAKGELSKKLAAFNHLMLPPGSGGSATLKGLLLEAAEKAETAESTAEEAGQAGQAGQGLEVSFQSVVDGLLEEASEPAEPAEPAAPRSNLRVEGRRLWGGGKGTVDWSHDPSVGWMTWLVDEVVGPEKLNQAIRWAWKDSKTIAIPGPTTPIASSVIKQPDAGLELHVTAYLMQAVLEGADGMSAFTPVQAIGPNDLRFKVSWGTADRPAFSLGVDTKVIVEAVDLKTSKTQASVVQEMSLHLGLLKPSLDATGQVLVLSEEWPGKHTFAQFLVAPAECLSSIFKSAPLLKKLEVQFNGLASPLTFQAKTSGALEASLASLLNNGVALFNNVYEPLLPGAIQRFASSDALMTQLNAKLKEQLQPKECISPAMASQHARQTLPQYYGDWPPIFGSVARKVIDNFFDGLIAHNTSALTEKDGLGNMPKLPMPLDARFTLRELVATGLDQVTNLRVLEPDAKHPSFLGMSAVAKCPAAEKPYRPTFIVNGTVQAGNFGGDGAVSLEMDCGTAQAELDVVIDVFALIDMEIPPSVSCALLSPLHKLDINNVNATWLGSGALIVKPNDGSAQDPLQQLCDLHPRLCEMAAKFRVYASKTDGASKLVQVARDAILSKCTEMPKLSASASATSYQLEGPKDSLGFSYLPADSATLWLVSILVVLALSLTYGLCAKLGENLPSCGCGELTAKSPIPLATFCLTSHAGLPKTATLVTSTLMAAGLVTRILACFWLPFATAGMEVIQQSGASLVKEDALLEYTFSGIGVQFGRGGSLYCQTLWFGMCLLAPLACHALLVLVWLTPFLPNRRRTLLLVGLVLGRLPLAEMETIGNSAMVLSSTVQMPLGISQTLGLFLQAGAYCSWLSTVFTLCANLLLLKLLPRPVKENDWAANKAPGFVTAAQGLASVAMLVGIVLWWRCDFMYAEPGGVAGTILDPDYFSASQLGQTDAALKAMIYLTGIGCPCLHVLAFFLGVSGKASDFARSLGGFAATFCLLDLFALGYLPTFVEGVNGFASSAVRSLAPAICEVAQTSLGEDCLTMTVSVLPWGTFGLLLATGAWNVLLGVQVLGLGQGKDQLQLGDGSARAALTVPMASGQASNSNPSTFQQSFQTACRNAVEMTS